MIHRTCFATLQRHLSMRPSTAKLPLRVLSARLTLPRHLLRFVSLLSNSLPMSLTSLFSASKARAWPLSLPPFSDWVLDSGSRPTPNFQVNPWLSPMPLSSVSHPFLHFAHPVDHDELFLDMPFFNKVILLIGGEMEGDLRQILTS